MLAHEYLNTRPTSRSDTKDSPPIFLSLTSTITFATLALAALIGSAIAFARRRPRLSLACLLLTSLLAKFPAAFDPTLHAWDERFHALVAKNLVHHPLVPTLLDNPVLPYDYTQWQENHIWLHKPPMALWLIAGSFALLGNTPFALRFPSLLFSTAAIALTYAIGKRLFSLRIALAAAYFHAICIFLIALAEGRLGMDHIDTTMIFFVEFGIYFALRQIAHPRPAWLLAIALALAAAILTKWLPGLLIVAVWQFLPAHTSLLRRAAELSAVLLVAAALVLPWYLYIHHAFPIEAQYEQHFNFLHLVQPLEGHDQPIYFYFLQIPIYFGLLAPLAILVFLIAALRKTRLPAMPAVAAWFLITYIFFSLARTRLSAYVFIAAPSIFLMCGWFFSYIHDRFPAPRWRIARPAFLIALILCPFAIGFLDFNFHRSKADQHLLDVCRYLRDKLPTKISSPNAVIFNVQHPTELMFYTSFTAYYRYPSLEDIATLKKTGHPIILCEDPAAPLHPIWRKNRALTILPIPTGL